MDSAGARARFERSLAGEIVRELVRIEAVDRALALASKLFVAIIPLSILLRSLALGSGSEDFGDDLVQRLGLSGLGASATRTLFAKGSEVRGAVSVIGILIVLYSVLSFTRALQRVYLNVWRLRPQLPDALLRELTWIAGFIAYTVILAPLRNFEHSHDVPSLYGPSAIALGAVFWLWTPYILLGKRIPWHRLIPTGFVTTVAHHRLLDRHGHLPTGHLHHQRRTLRAHRHRLRDGHLAVRLRRRRDRERRPRLDVGPAPGGAGDDGLNGAGAVTRAHRRRPERRAGRASRARAPHRRMGSTESPSHSCVATSLR